MKEMTREVNWENGRERGRRGERGGCENEELDYARAGGLEEARTRNHSM